MAIRSIRPLTTDNFTYTIAALPNIRFTSATGLSDKRAGIPYYDGYNQDPQLLRQEPERATITLKVPYDPAYVAPIVKWINNFNIGGGSVLTVQPFKYENGVRTDYPQVLTCYDVQPIEYTLPEGTAGGADIAYLTLVVSSKPPRAV